MSFALDMDEVGRQYPMTWSGATTTVTAPFVRQTRWMVEAESRPTGATVESCFRRVDVRYRSNFSELDRERARHESGRRELRPVAST